MKSKLSIAICMGLVGLSQNASAVTDSDVNSVIPFNLANPGARSLGMGLDQKAIEAVRQWKFEPAKLNGQAVPVQINVEVNFRLY